jgi:hypothetical protein
MHLNRVLMEFRQTAPEHKVWVTAVKECMLAIQALASTFCPGGLVWTATPAAPCAGACHRIRFADRSNAVDSSTVAWTYRSSS